MALHTFPTRAEGRLDVWEVDNADVQFSEWKYCCRCLPEPVWQSAYCVCLENEQKFLIFSNYLVGITEISISKAHSSFYFGAE
ncbi:hypothetical protein P879_10750 [Paragonimus westermani]|uniref:Uncharacterized protein n=1 Tax=Paragonimus westermani TaxID=34504 RepID=A0A8T0DC10_9TREM|nr:hypothetical protein P879_10750 [Paragonimus westermani]